MKILFLMVVLFCTLFSSEIRLTQKQADYIAKKVWHNEGAGKDKYLAKNSVNHRHLSTVIQV